MKSALANLGLVALAVLALLGLIAATGPNAGPYAPLIQAGTAGTNVMYLAPYILGPSTNGTGSGGASVAAGTNGIAIVTNGALVTVEFTGAQPLLYGATNYGVTMFGTNASGGELAIDGLGQLTQYSTNAGLFKLYNANTNPLVILDGSTGNGTYAGVVTATNGFVATTGSYYVGNASQLTNNDVWQTANYVLSANDTFVLLAANLTATMPSPSAATVMGKMIVIQCSGNGTNAILPSGAETFNGKGVLGATKWTNSAQGNATILVSNGTNWWIAKTDN